MTLHREIHFEGEICADLTAASWFHAEGDAGSYDRARALFPADVPSWVQATLPAAWATLSKSHWSSKRGLASMPQGSRKFDDNSFTVV